MDSAMAIASERRREEAELFAEEVARARLALRVQAAAATLAGMFAGDIVLGETCEAKALRYADTLIALAEGEPPNG